MKKLILIRHAMDIFVLPRADDDFHFNTRTGSHLHIRRKMIAAGEAVGHDNHVGNTNMACDLAFTPVMRPVQAFWGVVILIPLVYKKVIGFHMEHPQPTFSGFALQALGQS